MIGMSFSAFLTPLVFGLVSAFVLNTITRYRMLAGVDGFVCAWIAGWAGTWLGSPVFGYWGGHMQNVYIIPALLGAFVGTFLATAVVRAMVATTVVAPRPTIKTPQASAVPQQPEMRKAN
jgi:uncharacterized membrane protein YeaQ/YmgE (transglycosylase-associated protein family)